MELTLENMPLLNDMIINKIVKNKSAFTEDIYNKAIEIYNQRNLDSEAKQKLISEFPKILAEAKEHASKKKASKESLATLFHSKGIEEAQIPNLVGQVYVPHKVRAESRASNRQTVFIIIGIILLVIKFILRNG